jgi:hypothetical protein
MKSIHGTAALAAITLLAACAPMGEPSARNPTRAQFLDEVWVQPAYRGKCISEQFSKVYFAPVITANLSRQGWWQSQSAISQRQLEGDARKLATNFRQSLINAARSAPGRRITVVNQPGPDTLTIETAITHLVPAKAYWNSAATAAGFVVPGAGLLSAAGAGSITVEGRLTDGNNGAKIATFRDHMKDKMAVININSYKWYGGSEANLQETAVNIASAINSPPGKIINKPSPVTLIAY